MANATAIEARPLAGTFAGAGAAAGAAAGAGPRTARRARADAALRGACAAASSAVQRRRLIEELLRVVSKEQLEGRVDAAGPVGRGGKATHDALERLDLGLGVRDLALQLLEFSLGVGGCDLSPVVGLGSDFSLVR